MAEGGAAVSTEGKRWLRKRVRVGAGCAPEVTMAEGVVVAYAAAPTITVRDEQGRDSTWQTTLPIDVLGEADQAELRDLMQLGPMARAVDTRPSATVWIVWDYSWMDHDLLIKGTFATELEAKMFDGVEGVGRGWVVQEVALPERAEPDTVPRSRELRSQIYEFLGARTSRVTGDPHGHESLRKLADELAQRIEQLPMPIEDKLGEILRGAGIEHPLGLRGVRDLVNQRDGHLERAREAEDERDRAQQALMAKLGEAGQLREERDRVLSANVRQAGMIHERDAKLRVAHERAEEAERRLANVREMVRRLRAAAGGGVTPGYVLVRIEDMLNGQEPT